MATPRTRRSPNIYYGPDGQVLVLTPPVDDCPPWLLSPGPPYDGNLEDVDPYVLRWPLTMFPDWPISDSWRDFAFEEVVFHPGHLSPCPPGSPPDESFPRVRRRPNEKRHRIQPSKAVP